MKSSEQQLRRGLAAAKRELRRRQREDKTMRRRLVDMNHALGALLGDDSVEPSCRDYSTTKSTFELLLDLEKKQMQLSWEARKFFPTKAKDRLAERLFDRADSEYATTRGDLPGEDYLILFAKGQAAKLALPRETGEVLTSHRAKKHIKQRKKLLDGGYMTLGDFVDPWNYGDASDPTIDK
ncbi:MAG: hypothetical protein RJQ10_18200 [Haliea sp.]|uniref:hypothetical protein n=1 Tax=Haliea sp. TaxID=1932666 RepID=UPI0032EE88FD